MITRLRTLRGAYPSQFWLLFWGQLLITFGASMIWPFLMIYVSEQLDIKLTAVASLMTINAVMTLAASFIGGPIIDRVGRKWVMVISLAVTGLSFLLMVPANTLLAFAVLMGLRGAFRPLFQVGADAMMADIIAPEQRADAYSLLRLIKNVGVAMGPAIGGFITTSSYSFAFFIAAFCLTTYSLIMAIFAQETLPVRLPTVDNTKESFGGYGQVLNDKLFISFAIAFTLTQVCATLIWVLLGVYAKQNFQIPENQFGLIATTNAVMVVLLQYPVTQMTKRHEALRIMAIGTLLYAIGVSSIAAGSGFWSFWLSMVIMTFGELTLIPTATTFTANLAPPDMRGRYMSIYNLTWGLAAGIGPLLGGLLNDALGPQSIWLGGGLVGFMSVAVFIWLAYRNPQPSLTSQDLSTPQ
jgi:MFS family permease